MDLSLQQVLNLRKVQDDSNTSTACYLDLYRKIMKKLYTADLRNLVGFRNALTMAL
ncbi:GL23080 [Drosophila persimilis]|uniref:GL23080 n=1 Tax=Drosophila persimilis TaxID=7234 RepID=B4G3J6_DROPE|nr:GL23080 [Drosophila persimilis]